MFTEVLNFWFRETEPSQWWTVDPECDARIRDRFLPLLEKAARGSLAGWRQTPEGLLAEVISLDQFSRNIFRNTPRAFLQDPMAFAVSREAVTYCAMAFLEPMERVFLLMPYMHSESFRVHQEAEHLFKKWTPANNYQFELRHKAIIDRFGRYPHRNKI